MGPEAKTKTFRHNNNWLKFSWMAYSADCSCCTYICLLNWNFGLNCMVDYVIVHLTCFPAGWSESRVAEKTRRVSSAETAECHPSFTWCSKGRSLLGINNHIYTFISYSFICYYSLLFVFIVIVLYDHICILPVHCVLQHKPYFSRAKIPWK